MVSRYAATYAGRMPKLSSILARNLKTMRAKAGLTQEDLAERTPLSQSTWSRLELGQWGQSIDKIEQALESLGLDPKDLLVSDLRSASGSRELLEMWAQVDDETRSIVLNLLRRVARGSQSPRDSKQAQ